MEENYTGRWKTPEEFSNRQEYEDYKEKRMDKYLHGQKTGTPIEEHPDYRQMFEGLSPEQAQKLKIELQTQPDPAYNLAKIVIAHKKTGQKHKDSFKKLTGIELK